MKMYKTLVLAITLALILTAFKISAAQTNTNNGPENLTLSDEEKSAAVNSISKLLNDNYIFPDAAKSMSEYLQSQLKTDKYKNLADPVLFADQLTIDLQSVSKDKHIRVRFSPEQVKMMKQENHKDEDEVSPEYLRQLKEDNYGFRKVERLSGNIGYIDFRMFGPGDQIKDKVSSVMGFLEDCNAIIFDLRNNGGGDPSGVQVISSYLFGEQPVHLNDLYYRPKDTTEQYWTLKDIKGKRMPDIPVYVLTSSFTFSGAEEFAYNLKNLKRATIVGETTGGGAHPGGMEIVDDNFLMFVPTGRAINPVTKTNWEGTGVSPDVEISSMNALTKAHILALQNSNKNSASGESQSNVSWLIESLTATLTDININDEMLRSYAGTYGERKVFYEKGKLYYQRAGRQKFELTPMTENTFMLKDVEYFRIKFTSDDTGKITSLTGMYDDGRTDNSTRTE